MPKLVIHSQDHLHFIDQDEIIYCKSDNCYTDIYLADGKNLLISKSLLKFSAELESGKFVRVSQSYLVNIKYIKSVDKKKKQIRLIDESSIPYTTTIRELLCVIGNTVLLYFVVHGVDLFPAIWNAWIDQ